MEASILTSIKKLLGLDDAYTAFDLDIIIHINSAFSNLTQLGVGPVEGFMIEDKEPKWEDYFGDEVDDLELNRVKTYIGLKVRIWFDPPTTSYAIAAVNDEITQLEWRMNIHREETKWTDPDPPIPAEEVV